MVTDDPTEGEGLLTSSISFSAQFLPLVQALKTAADAAAIRKNFFIGSVYCWDDVCTE
jgi:hypothetical protein